MSELAPASAPEILAALQANAAEAAAALGRALDGQFTLTVGEAAAYNAQAAPEDFDGRGLAVLLKVGEQGLAVVIPETSGLLPDWYRGPDAGGASKLNTLAQELRLLALPAAPLAELSAAGAVDDLKAALARGGVAPDAVLAALDVVHANGRGQLHLVWPLRAPDSLLNASTSDPSTASSTSFLVGASSPSSTGIRDFSQLPHYSRSLLKIRVPVSVNLAVKKETVQEVVELVPGSIIKFEKGCDEHLHMVVGGQQIAEGEAVKIGDKFGFRVTAMLLPQEHFIQLKRPRAG